MNTSSTNSTKKPVLKLSEQKEILVSRNQATHYNRVLFILSETDLWFLIKTMEPEDNETTLKVIKKEKQSQQKIPHLDILSFKTEKEIKIFIRLK